MIKIKYLIFFIIGIILFLIKNNFNTFNVGGAWRITGEFMRANTDQMRHANDQKMQEAQDQDRPDDFVPINPTQYFETAGDLIDYFNRYGICNIRTCGKMDIQNDVDRPATYTPPDNQALPQQPTNCENIPNIEMRDQKCIDMLDIQNLIDDISHAPVPSAPHKVGEKAEYIHNRNELLREIEKNYIKNIKKLIENKRSPMVCKKTLNKILSDDPTRVPASPAPSPSDDDSDHKAKKPKGDDISPSPPLSRSLPLPLDIINMIVNQSWYKVIQMFKNNYVKIFKIMIDNAKRAFIVLDNKSQLVMNENTKRSAFKFIYNYRNLFSFIIDIFFELLENMNINDIDLDTTHVNNVIQKIFLLFFGNLGLDTYSGGAANPVKNLNIDRVVNRMQLRRVTQSFIGLSPYFGSPKLRKLIKLMFEKNMSITLIKSNTIIRLNFPINIKKVVYDINIFGSDLNGIKARFEHLIQALFGELFPNDNTS